MTPDEYTISQQYLNVSDGHQLFVYEWGNPKAKTPIVNLHGGPGGACKDRYKTHFNPEKQRVIFFDQRGSGKSLPYGELKNNTTAHLVEDIAAILDHFKIKKAILRGGSWGSTLALTFALKHPQRTEALVIAGVFTGSKLETDWLDHGGYRNFYPDVWEKFVAGVPEKHKTDPTAYYYQQVMSDDEVAAKAAGHAYEAMEGGVLSLNDEAYTPDALDDYDPSAIRIEMHYLHNLCFMPDNYIMDNAHKLTMPIYIIQGRYDSVCPPITAYELSKRAPNTELYWTIAGHRSEHEDGNLVRAILARITT
jgi:proline iminopeptidase